MGSAKKLKTLKNWRIISIFGGGVAIVAEDTTVHGGNMLTTPIVRAVDKIAETRSGSLYVLLQENRYPGDWEADIKQRDPESFKRLLTLLDKKRCVYSECRNPAQISFVIL